MASLACYSQPNLLGREAVEEDLERGSWRSGEGALCCLAKSRTSPSHIPCAV